MKILGLVITTFLFWNVRTVEIVTKTIRWTNLNDFLAANWTYDGHNAKAPDQWEGPLDLDSRLLNLTNNFTDKVWGWKATNDEKTFTKYFQLDWYLLPEYCGLINATLELKFYFTDNEEYMNFMWPVVGGSGNPYLFFEALPFVGWQTVSGQLNTSYMNATSHTSFVIQHYTPEGEIFIIDEVRLTYSVRQDGENCPYSCDHDCEYRAIDCHQYYTCVDRKYKKIYSCSKDEGLAFNPVTKTCDLLEKVEGCNSPPENCVCSYKPHETNCSSYYYCNNTCHPEECEERHCPSGLTWSTDALGDGSGLQQCVSDANKTCQSERKRKNSTAQIRLPQVEESGNMVMEDASATT